MTGLPCRECYMKTGDDVRSPNTEVVSGPKYCSTAGMVTTPSPLDNCTQAGRVCLKGGSRSEGNYRRSQTNLRENNVKPARPAIMTRSKITLLLFLHPVTT